jgi:hypothetical protein
MFVIVLFFVFCLLLFFVLCLLLFCSNLFLFYWVISAIPCSGIRTVTKTVSFTKYFSILLKLSLVSDQASHTIVSTLTLLKSQRISLIKLVSEKNLYHQINSNLLTGNEPFRTSCFLNISCHTHPFFLFLFCNWLEMQLVPHLRLLLVWKQNVNFLYLLVLNGINN